MIMMSYQITYTYQEFCTQSYICIDNPNNVYMIYVLLVRHLESIIMYNQL